MTDESDPAAGRVAAAGQRDLRGELITVGVGQHRPAGRREPELDAPKLVDSEVVGGRGGDYRSSSADRGLDVAWKILVARREDSATSVGGSELGVSDDLHSVGLCEASRRP